MHFAKRENVPQGPFVVRWLTKCLFQLLNNTHNPTNSKFLLSYTQTHNSSTSLCICGLEVKHTRSFHPRSLPYYTTGYGEEVQPIQNKDYVNSNFISIHVLKVKKFFKPRHNYKTEICSNSCLNSNFLFFFVHGHSLSHYSQTKNSCSLRPFLLIFKQK